MSIRVDWFVGLLSVCTTELYSCFLERSDFLIDDWMIVQRGYIHIYFLHYKMLNVYFKGRNLKKGWEFYRLIICIKILWLFLQFTILVYIWIGNFTTGLLLTSRENRLDRKENYMRLNQNIFLYKFPPQWTKSMFRSIE